MARLRAALLELTPEQRAVVSMFYLDEMPLRDIAKVFCLPLGTVKSRLFYARNRLRQVLERSDR